MGVKSTTTEHTKGRVPTTFPCIVKSNALKIPHLSGVIFLLSKEYDSIQGTVIANPKGVFKIGWNGACEPKNYIVYDEPVTLQNE